MIVKAAKWRFCHGSGKWLVRNKLFNGVNHDLLKPGLRSCLYPERQIIFVTAAVPIPPVFSKAVFLIFLHPGAAMTPTWAQPVLLRNAETSTILAWSQSPLRTELYHHQLWVAPLDCHGYCSHVSSGVCIARSTSIAAELRYRLPFFVFLILFAFCSTSAPLSSSLANPCRTPHHDHCLNFCCYPNQLWSCTTPSTTHHSSMLELYFQLYCRWLEIIAPPSTCFNTDFRGLSRLCSAQPSTLVHSFASNY